MSQRPHCSSLGVEQRCLPLSLVLYVACSTSVPSLQTAVLLYMHFFPPGVLQSMYNEAIGYLTSLEKVMH